MPASKTTGGGGLDPYAYLKDVCSRLAQHDHWSIEPKLLRCRSAELVVQARVNSHSGRPCTMARIDCALFPT